MKQVLIPLVLLLAFPVQAQESASYRLTEHVLNAGGHPSGGVVMASASYKVTLDALGEGVVQIGMNSTTYRLDAGFVSAYPPPGEVTELLFTDQETLVWSREKSAGVYDLYRDDSPAGYGNCEQQELPGPPATDPATPSEGNSFFYLATVKNRLREEGTKGFRSNGDERRGATELPICP